MDTGVLDNKAKEALVLWHADVQKRLERAAVQKLVGAEPELRDLQSSWLVTGDVQAILRKIIPPPPVQAAVTHPQENADDLSPEAARAQFDRGFARVASFVPDNVPVSAPWPLQRLAALKAFHRDSVLWAELDGDAIRALQSGRNTAWRAIVPSNHRRMREQHDTFTAHADWGVNMLTILPRRFTDTWAGVAGMHEDSHLYDIATGAEGAKRSRSEYMAGEVRAYAPEILLTDMVSGGRFVQGLDRMLQALGVQSREDAVRIVRDQGDGRLGALIHYLDPLVTPEPAQSLSEQDTRNALYVMALVFRLTELRVPEGEARFKEHMRDVETLMCSDPRVAAMLPQS